MTPSKPRGLKMTVDNEWQFTLKFDDRAYVAVPAHIADKLMSVFNRCQDDKMPDALKDALFDLDAYKQHGEV